MSGIIFICLGLVGKPVTATTPQQIYQKASPAVVFILVAEGSQMTYGGTGSIIREDGLIITNAHVFTSKGSSRMKSDISIFLKPQRLTGNHKKDLSLHYRGKVLAYDIPLDLALLQIVDLNLPLTRIAFANSQVVDIGDTVYAIGHPEQGGLWSLTTGVISAYRQNYGGIRGKNLFQTDASINRGNSGGPLLDVNGYMVGINSLIARKADDGMTITDVNYSIMSDVALKWLADLGYRFQIEEKEMTKTVKKNQAVSEGIEKESSRPVVENMESPYQPKPIEKSSRTKSFEENTEIEPDKSGNTPPPSSVQAPPQKVTCEGNGSGKILTEKKPYEMSQLLKDMQEMEKMMEDMKKKIRKYKK
jgi:serine protease Do